LCKRAAAGCGHYREGSRKGTQSPMESRHFDLPGITMNVSMFFYLEHLAAPAGIQYLSAAASNEKPAATVSQAGVFLLRRLREAVPTCV
jgi:hypothetical protein